MGNWEKGEKRGSIRKKTFNIYRKSTGKKADDTYFLYVYNINMTEGGTGIPIRSVWEKGEEEEEGDCMHTDDMERGYPLAISS